MPRTILILASNPADTNKLDLSREYKQIKLLQQEFPQGSDYVVDYIPDANAQDLQQQLLRNNPYLVHFCGHGETDGLCFQSANGNTHFIHQDSLSDFFKLFAGRIHCLILNACSTEQQAKAISQHIDYVIGMNAKIGDEAAVLFAGGFYRALFNGETVEKAFEFGRSAVDLANNLEFQTPQLFKKDAAFGENPCKSFVELESPDGTVPLNSPFYVERPPIENDCYNTIERLYALIRIKAPRQMGKTSLLDRVLNHAQQQQQRTVKLSFQELDNETFETLDNLLRLFCATIADQLNLPDQIEESWKGVLGAKSKATNYFQKYLLKNYPTLTLGLDEVDEVFKHEKVASEFFALLRAWHEKSKSDPLWKNMRLVITHSKEVYIPLHINQSPFNVGTPVELPEFTAAQVDNLRQRYQIAWSNAELAQFMNMVGGHPYLVRLGLHQIACQRLSLEKFLQIAPTEEWLYREHLRRHLLNLKEAALTEVTLRVMNAVEPILIDSNDAFKLQSMGLVRWKGNKVEALCQLYRLYFKERL